MGETYYDVLEVDADASQDDIQSAYRDRVLETHPDHNDAPNATEQFRRVSRAESVLTDATERARYDRLGHDAYVRHFGSDDSTGADSDASKSKSRTGADHRTRTATAQTTEATESSSQASTGTESSSQASTGTESSSQTSEADANTERRTASTANQASEHDEQRATSARQSRTRAETARHSDARERATSRNADSRSVVGAGPTARAQPGSDDADRSGEDDAEFRYSVHDWDEEIDLEWESRSLSHTTAVTIGCLWMLYPILVASSLTSLFPTVVNAIVGACTLGIVGYVLLRPRIAAVVFGSWSLVFPLVLLQFGIVAPTSLVGILVLSCVWIPFGYAIGLWWALKP